MVSYTKQKKNIQLSCFVDGKEAERIRQLAKDQDRTVSNFLYTKLKEDLRNE